MTDTFYFSLSLPGADSDLVLRRPQIIAQTFPKISKLRYQFILILSFLLFCCDSKQTVNEDWKIIETDAFVIKVSNNWRYIEGKGLDSFVGMFVIDSEDRKDTLHFDFSESGFANSLIPSQSEYIDEHRWEWEPQEFFIKPGIYYTSGDLQAFKKQIMKEEGITDSLKVRVEPIPRPEVKVVQDFPDSTNSSYVAYLTYRDSTVTVRVELPDKIQNHQIMVDTVGYYKRKIILPKENQKEGMTGIYLKDLTSLLNFQINGSNLPKDVQAQAIEAFESIKIK